jgi:hypothetical protein
MISNASLSLLFIEPRGRPSSVPVIDALTRRMAGAWRTRTRLCARDPKTGVDEFYSFLGAMTPTPPTRAKLTARLRSLCDDVDRTRDAKEGLARQRSDDVDAVKRAEDELKNATAELKDVQGGAHQVFGYNGMMIAAMSDHRYVVTQLEARIVRNSYCAPGGRLQRAE